MKLEKIMKSISDKMKLDYRDLTKEIKHSGSKGDEREGIVRNFLKMYLHNRFAVVKGEIVATNGKTSKQQDVIIYDLAKCPLLYSGENIQILPAEGVYVVIEVKSLLDEKELVNSIKNIKSVKSLPKKAFIKEKKFYKEVVSELGERKNYFNTMGVLFVYSSKFKLETLKKKIKEKYKKLKISPEHQIDFIFILDKGLIVQYDKIQKQIKTTVELNTDLGIVKTEEGLLLFYLLLMERLGSIFIPPISIKDYAKFMYKIKLD